MTTGDDRRARALARRVLSRTVLLDTLIIGTGVFIYFRVRGLTVGATSTAVAHAHDLMRLEVALGLDIERGVQEVFGVSGPLITLANWVYIWGHWPVIIATFVWLALHDRVVFRRLRNAMIVSGGLGLCVFTTYPVAPPRLAGFGLVDTITEQSRAYRVLQPPAFTNPYAALPSLHFGWNLLVGLAMVAACTTVVMRTVGRVMPAAMGMATVLTANHYVLDLVAGVVFALVGWGVALQLEKRRRAPAEQRPPPGGRLPDGLDRMVPYPRVGDPVRVPVVDLADLTDPSLYAAARRRAR